MAFNLEPPPGFRGFDPSGSFRVYYRNLPHWRQDGATYFVTFQLADALPACRLKELASMRREWELRCPPPRSENDWIEYARQAFRTEETCLDAGHGACLFRHAAYADELCRAVLHFHGTRYEVGCFVVMANHCHLLMRPFKGFELEKEIGAIKKTVAARVNEAESQLGPLWRPESYDRIVRDAEHLHRVVQYIGANPRKAGIPRDDWCRWMNPEWQTRCWDFQE